MFYVNNKDTRTTPMPSFCCLYCYLGTYFTPSSSVSIVNFEQINYGWGCGSNQTLVSLFVLELVQLELSMLRKGTNSPMPHQS